MTASKGFLFLDTATLLRRRGTRVEVHCEQSGEVYQSDGELAERLWAFAQDGSGELPTSLLGEHFPGLQASLSGPRSELTPTSALRLGGFGTLFLELTGRCNERCVHCYAGSGPEVTDTLSREICEAVLQDAKQLDFRRVQFTGGDPLLHKQLVDILAENARLELPDPEIYTNGLALTPALLTRLREFQPSFAFSFYSANAEVHDGITQVAGSQQRTLRAIRRCLEADLNVRVSIVLMPANLQDFEPTVAYLESMGVRQIGWSGTAAVGRGTWFPLPPSIRAEGGAHQGSSSTEESRTPSGTLCVSSTGQVYPCVFNRESSLGSVYERKLREIVAAPNKKRRRLTANPCGQLLCGSCRLTESALGAAAGAGE